MSLWVEHWQRFAKDIRKATNGAGLQGDIPLNHGNLRAYTDAQAVAPESI
jgi:hypothetical protein